MWPGQVMVSMGSGIHAVTPREQKGACMTAASKRLQQAVP